MLVKRLLSVVTTNLKSLKTHRGVQNCELAQSIMWKEFSKVENNKKSQNRLKIIKIDKNT